MKIAIVGSRSFNSFEILETFILSKIELSDISIMVSGGAIGADSLGEEFANKYSIEKEIYYPNWDLYGRKAGYIRNELIIKNSDIVFAFWDGRSKGTLNSIEISKKLNKALYIFSFTMDT